MTGTVAAWVLGVLVVATFGWMFVRLRAEKKALQLSEERFALAVAGSSDGIFDWDLVTDQMYMSDRAQEFFGVEQGPSLRPRMQWMSLTGMPAEDVLDATHALYAHLRGETSTFITHYRLEHPNGTRRWFRMRGAGLRNPDGRVYRMAGSLEEITERKRADEALQQSVERLRASEAELRARQEMLELAQRAARAAPFEWNFNSKDGERRMSPELAALYGISAEDFKGTEEAWQQLVHPEDRQRVREAARVAFVSGEFDTQYRTVRPDGTIRWIRTRGRLIRDAAGNPERIVSFNFDETDQHAADRKQLELEQQLRQAQRLEAMGTLAGGIAHDFNNILNAILGYCELALRDARPGSRLRHDIESIQAAGERGEALVDRILAFSRSAVGERVPVHVEKLVEEALDLHAARLPQGVTLERSLRTGRGAMLGDPTQIFQVVMNLVANAAQAMPTGGTLRVSLELRTLEPGHAAIAGAITGGEYIVLEVADTGTGIPSGVLDRIFEPFFTTKEVGVGTGLGLSLVHGIVTQIGGAIGVSTEVGKGSVFTVFLPRCGEAVDEAEPASRGVPRGEQQRVLVVDDEESQVRLATRTLADLGYEPIGFTSSTAALEAFQAEPSRFDALVTDARMPGMSGSALIGKVRDIRRDIPILLISGHLGASAVDREDARADEVLKKPFSSRDLALSLARVLSR
jgi:PAS domain S-box-containing protein